MIGVNQMRKFWNKVEDDVLYKHYFDAPTETLCTALSHRTWDAIKLRAAKLGLSRSKSLNRKSAVENLLSGSLESFYWMGFILADGHIGKNVRLVVSLSKKDESHLTKLANFINTEMREGISKIESKEYARITISCQNIDVVPIIAEIYDINSNKTENPPDFYNYVFTDEQMLSLIIGFIDGDGNINKLHERNDVNLRIKCHSSWLSNIHYIEELIYTYFGFDLKEPPITKINNEGYAQLVISNNKIIKNIKQFALDRELPIMQRKWDRVQ